MLAEIKGKISSKGTNLTERMEDKLTGDFFGALRYIPFNKAMKQILKSSRIIRKPDNNLEQCLHSLNANFWEDNIKLWPLHSLGELDVLLTFEKIIIGIEVKYRSKLSSDDDVENPENYQGEEKSINQLAIESEILKSLQINNAILLLYIAPEPECHLTALKVLKRNILNQEVSFGYLSWEMIYEKIEKIIRDDCSLNSFEKLILKDLRQLLRKKGFERFRRFDMYKNNVDSDRYFTFENRHQESFDFKINTIVLKGVAYEFGR